jgi:3-oxoacyl-[acyl-carrier-protein] synthase II
VPSLAPSAPPSGSAHPRSHDELGIPDRVLLHQLLPGALDLRAYDGQDRLTWAGGDGALHWAAAWSGTLSQAEHQRSFGCGAMGRPANARRFPEVRSASCRRGQRRWTAGLARPRRPGPPSGSGMDSAAKLLARFCHLQARHFRRRVRSLSPMGPYNGRRVVVTGMGFVTPLGNDQETVWSNLVEGVSGVGPITRFDASDYPARIAAEVRDFDPGDYMDRKSARHLARYCQFGLAAARQALERAGLDPRRLDPDQVGVIIASGIGGMEEIERNHAQMLERGIRRISPFTVPMMIADMASGVVAMQVGAGGINYAIVSACASSGHAIGEAAEIIKRGDAEAMIAGGAEATITPLTMGAFCQIKAVSERNHEPERACRPFDAERDGFVMGEGAVVLVLEELGFARRRGAPILAEIAGYGASADMHHFTAPHPEGAGAIRAMRRALDKAGVRPEQVDYVNAHGTSTRLGDVAETKAIKEVFGDHARRLAVSSTKSMHAHLLGAAGAMEAAACVLAIRHDLIPPTINLDHPDPECDLDYVPNRARPARVEVAISNSFGFGGHNSTLVIRRPEPE